MVKEGFVDTLNVHKSNKGEYPSRLFNLLSGVKYDGWILLARKSSPEPDDKVLGLEGQLILFKQIIADCKIIQQ